MSDIFTNAELQELELRRKGMKKNYRIWYKARKKIGEMLKTWMIQKELLEKIYNDKGRTCWKKIR